MRTAPLRLALLALTLPTLLPTAFAAPAHACLQEGVINAAPPFIPEPIRIKECSSFDGGAEAVQAGQAWCASAGRMVLGPKDAPPKVTTVAACPAGALAMCAVTTPGSSVVNKRYHYIAGAGAGGLEGLRKSGERHTPGMPAGVFTKF